MSAHQIACHACAHRQILEGPPVPACCPVCSGKGRVPAGFYGAVGVNSWDVADLTSETCRSCNGTGVVWR